MRFGVALICVMVFASGCGPSEREKFEATEKLLSAFDKDIKSSRADYIRLLISEGADVNAKGKNGMTPLLYASQHEIWEVVTLLVKAGADVNARFTDGTTPLMHAAGNSSTPEIVQLLLEKGAEVNARSPGGTTPLMFAARFSSTPEIVQLLLEKGADVNAKGKNGYTPLMFAAMNTEGKSAEMEQLLIDAGATE